MGKIRFRDSLANMLGEFVALNKSPDYRPNAQSTQFIREAIKSEIEAQKCKSSHLFGGENDYSRPVHFRTCSTNSGYRNMPVVPEDNYLSGRRQSLPVMRAPARLFQRLRGGSKKGKYEVEAHHNEIRNAETRRRNSVISESDETDSNMSTNSSRRQSHASCHEQAHGLNMRL